MNSPIAAPLTLHGVFMQIFDLGLLLACRDGHPIGEGAYP